MPKNIKFRQRFLMGKGQIQANWTINIWIYTSLQLFRMLCWNLLMSFILQVGFFIKLFADHFTEACEAKWNIDAKKYFCVFCFQHPDIVQWTETEQKHTSGPFSFSDIIYLKKVVERLLKQFRVVLPPIEKDCHGQRKRESNLFRLKLEKCLLVVTVYKAVYWMTYKM